MNKILVEVFDSETAAFEGMSALREFHAAGDTPLYEMTILLKDDAGKITVKQVDENAPTGRAVGIFSDGQIGILGGVGVPIGAVVGGLAGVLFDLFRSGNSVTFVDEVSKALTSGKAAVIADMTSRIN
jgi:uncharacterized membrane protein